MLAFYVQSGAGPLAVFWIGLLCLPVMAAAAPKFAAAVVGASRGISASNMQPTLTRLFGALSLAVALAAFGVFWFVIECSWVIWIFCD